MQDYTYYSPRILINLIQPILDEEYNLITVR